MLEVGTPAEARLTGNGGLLVVTGLRAGSWYIESLEVLNTGEIELN